jgi:hypothetical protein
MEIAAPRVRFSDHQPEDAVGGVAVPLIYDKRYVDARYIESRAVRLLHRWYDDIPRFMNLVIYKNNVILSIQLDGNSNVIRGSASYFVLIIYIHANLRGLSSSHLQ